MMIPEIALVVAISDNGVIGRSNELPWHLPADLKHFKALTMGHPMIMGRKTYESIGKPLPGRTTIIVTRDPEYKAEGCLIAHSIGAAITEARALDHERISIIGGAQIFEQALLLADTFYLTEVHADVPGDVFFTFDRNAWQETAREDFPADEKHALPFSFVTMVRK
jgi:dihydrofolate reductase